MEEGSSDNEVVFEEEVWEIEAEDGERPPEDGMPKLLVLWALFLPSFADLQEEMEGMGFEDEEEEEIVARNDATAIFKEHTGIHSGDILPLDLSLFSGSVFSVSLHPDGGLACSGGEDDRAFLWRVDDASVAMECKGKVQCAFLVLLLVYS